MVHTLSRLLIGAALVLACIAFTTTGRGAATFAPAIPLTSHHIYFDHQWYVWLPRHPTYEAVEVMSVDAPFNPYKLVWVIFTERDAPKRQHHFMSERGIAEGVDNFHYREIAYRRAGEAGEGQGVHVSFTALDDAAVEIAIDAEGLPLTTAGLTDQSGHSAAKLVMLFHRERSVRTERNRVAIDGQDFSFHAGDDPGGTHRFIAGYSAGIQIVVIPFGQWSFAADEAHLSDDAAGLSFAVEARTGGIALVAELPGFQDRATVELDATGALERYRHDLGAHRMVISLDEALPLTGAGSQAASRFSVLLDPDEPVASGRVVSAPTESGRRLSWTIDFPSWGLGYPFDSLVEQRDGGTALTVRSARQDD